MSCGVGHRHNSDPMLLWLWHMPAAVAPLRSLAWEPPYAVGVALKRKKERKKIIKSQQSKQRNRGTAKQQELS